MTDDTPEPFTVSVDGLLAVVRDDRHALGDRHKAAEALLPLGAAAIKRALADAIANGR